jgi:hypothetical protein
MCVVETKDAEQAIHMKTILEEKYDHLSITTIGVALGIDDDSDTPGDTDDEKNDGDTFKESASSPMPRSPMPGRRNIEAFSNKANQGLSIPIISVNSGRRGSMMVQTHVKAPEWKPHDVQRVQGDIDWSRRGTHYAVKEKRDSFRE